MSGGQPKCGPARDYSAAELALFAEYVNERARSRPPACTGGELCWVRYGPPCLDHDCVCAECRRVPPMQQLDKRHGGRKFAAPVFERERRR